MKISSRIALAGAVLFGAAGVAGVPQAQAGGVVPGPGDGSAAAVSYTHLTLPTSDLASISGGAVSFKKTKKKK